MGVLGGVEGRVVLGGGRERGKKEWSGRGGGRNINEGDKRHSE